ncbi:MAG: FHA domain-containing protein [Pseudomonadota bacterium]
MNILLKVLTGPHMGAELELTQGDWLVGSDFACDVLLVDVAILPRHALIRIAEDRAWLIPQDGGIVVDNVLVEQEGQELIPFKPFSLGGTYLCCGPAHRPWQAHEMPTLAALNEQAHSALTPTAQPSSQKTQEITTDAPASAHGTSLIEGELKQSDTPQDQTSSNSTDMNSGNDIAHDIGPNTWKTKTAWAIRIVLCLVLLSVLTLGIRHYTMPQDARIAIDVMLSKKPYLNVQAHEDNGTVLLQGFVGKNKDIVSLEELLQGLENAPPIVNTIMSLEDIADELRMIALEHDAIWNVRIRNATIYMNGYVQSKDDFVHILSPVQDKLRSIHSQIEMVYWDDLEKMLNEKVKTAQITHKVQFYPHTMRIAYATQGLTSEEEKRLETLLYEIEDQLLLGSIFIPMHAEPNTKGVVHAEAPKNAHTTDVNTLCASLSVAVQGHQTVLMVNGVPYAQGNRLPQGWLVQEIHPNYIVLLFDKQMHVCQPNIVRTPQQ